MNNEIDREALLIYLNDLRVMETIVHEDNKKISQINYNQNELRNDYYNFYTTKPIEPELTPLDNKATTDLSKICLGFFLFSLVIAIVLFIAGWNSLGICSCGGCILCLLSISKARSEQETNDKKITDENSLKLSKYKSQKEAYDNAMETKKSKYEKYSADTKTCLSEMQLEKDEINQKLQEAYNANIIPIQFRNIQGIYYLYDYMSTSSQGLSEALMQCNLDAIKQQLNKVIQLQGETIIKQAQQNAALYEQNQQILEAVQATMNNTAIAAKYAQISAINSEMSLRLQRKNLAYQRADYWLK